MLIEATDYDVQFILTSWERETIPTVGLGSFLGKSSARALVLAAILLCVAGWATQSWAQAKMPRVGILLISQGALQGTGHVTFTAALAQQGWVPGKNVVLEYRFARGESLQFDAAADELVQLKVDAIMAFSAPASRAAYAATKTIPIVAGDYTNDPVAAGYAQSYGRPGKNVTGVFLDAPEFAGKWIELLRAIVPGLKRVEVLWDPGPGATHLRAVQRAAQPLGIDIQVYEVRTPEEIDKAFAALRGRPQALIILPSPLTYTYSARLADLALQRRLPATFMDRAFADAGGTISYGPDEAETSQRLAVQVAKILNGAKPGDLPIERPTKFNFVINMRTAKALGLKIPDSLFLSAERVSR
jgi:putative ABC transport system substrate-binding protein